MSTAHASDGLYRRSDAHVDKINRITIRMLGFAALSFVVDLLLLDALLYAGMVERRIVVAFGCVGVAVVLLFYVLIRLRVNRKFKDPGMAVGQLVAGALVQLSFLVLAPDVGLIFLINLFSTSMFGLVALNSLQFTRLWIVMSIAMTGAFILVGDRIGFPNDVPLGQLLMCILFVFTLGQTVYLAGVISNLRLKLAHNNLALMEALKSVEKMATRDALTDVLNRRALLEILKIELMTFKRKGTPFCIAVLDIDHFKRINDAHGHAAGDEVLKTFVAIVQERMRQTDLFARYGGDEFVLVLVDTPHDVAVRALERICAGVAEHDWNAVAAGLAVTVSIGVGAIEHEDSVKQAFERADSALYVAKGAGRNTVRTAFDATVD
jgi:diguanylate cyclase (GGDEF)-like protein